MKQLILKHREWDRIFEKIKAEYVTTPSVYLMRNKMKEQLGFTVREHRNYNEQDVEYDLNNDWRDYQSQIHIDFYSEAARTMFVLKYL